MKIGIITFWKTQENYGQMLQAFAMQRFLEKLGHEPYLIRYHGEVDNPLMYSPKTITQKLKGVLKNPLKVFYYLLNKVNERKNRSLIANHNRRFDQFREKYIRVSSNEYHSLKDLRSNPPLSDAYLCGSDMIWNEPGCKRVHVLDFGTKEQLKIAYAPSFASANVSDDYVRVISPYLKKFNFIGTREKSGVEICKKAGYDDAKWVPDPTLLLDYNDYKEITVAPQNANKFIFVYLLGHSTNVSLTAIYNFAEQEGLEVIYVASQNRFDNYTKTHASVEEWLGYLQNAEYVYTNSFHCCVLSIISNRHFLFMPLKGNSEKANERIISLLESVDLQNRIFEKEVRFVKDLIDWSIVNEKLRIQKNETLELFKKSIEK